MIDRKLHAGRMLGKTFLAVAAFFLFLASAGCEVSYPKEELPDAVKQISYEEYGLEVEVTREGGTLGIFYPREELMNVTFGIKEEAWEDINSLLLIASRVLLSTDAEVKFYCIIAQDVQYPEMQIVIIKYVQDVKRTMYRAISRGESFRRTIFSHNLTPQAQKERSVEEVFDQMQLDRSVRESILEDFFRTQPSTLQDIGYWRERFYLKDITMEGFLAAQLANRIRLIFAQEEPFSHRFEFTSSEGYFEQVAESRRFVISFEISGSDSDAEAGLLRQEKVRVMLEEAGEVFYGYRFDDFDTFVMVDELTNTRIEVPAEIVYEYQRHPVPVAEAVDAPAGYF